MSLAHRAYDAWFRKIHGSRLIYNTCWEDPRADRELLAMAPGARLVMITSAGCNALDYLLDDPQRIDCVDMNPRQNALLELKLALLAYGDHALLFQLFGHGQHPQFAEAYAHLRPWLSASARQIWDRERHAFSPRGRGSFYFRGAAGDVAYGMRIWLKQLQPALWRELQQLLEAQTLDEQREHYARIEPRLWRPWLRWIARQPALLALLGVPRAQRNLIERQYPGGVNAYIEDKLRYLLTELPIRDNYFWRVYLHGSYSIDCCPNYLRPEHFAVLRERAARVHLHTCTLSEFLAQQPQRYDRFVLLDHQDWMAAHAPELLEQEWDQVVASSAPGARVLMRSAGLSIDFLPERARARLQARSLDCARWHQLDRVGTYGSVLCAEVQPA